MDINSVVYIWLGSFLAGFWLGLDNWAISRLVDHILDNVVIQFTYGILVKIIQR